MRDASCVEAYVTAQSSPCEVRDVPCGVPLTSAQRTALTALADGQHGCFTRQQALDAGIGVGAIEHHVRRGEWIAVDHGIYRSALTPESWSQRVLAACLAGPAVASHRSAAALWDAPGFDLGVIEVTARRHRRRKDSGVVWHESHHLDPPDVTAVGVIPVTDPCRTVIDLCRMLDPPGLVHVLDDFVRRRLVTPGEVLRRIESLGPRRRGSLVARRLVERRLDGIPAPESYAETDFDLLMGRYGIPRPVRQLEVHDAEGLIGRLDFAYPDLRIDIEIDGRRFHDSTDAAARDRRRDDRLEAVDWLVLRISADDVRFRPAGVAERIFAARFRRRGIGSRR